MDLNLEKLKKGKKPKITNVRINNDIYLQLKDIANKKNIPATRLINHLLKESLKLLKEED